VADKTVALRVVNQRKVEKALRAIGKDAVAELKQAHLESAKIVERAAKPKVPVRSGNRSVISNKPYWETSKTARTGYQSRYSGSTTKPGALRDSLRSGASSRAGVVRAGKKLVPYAGPVHYGWPSRPNPEKGWLGGPIPPNELLWDAMDERRAEVEEAFYRYLENIKKRHLD